MPPKNVAFSAEKRKDNAVVANVESELKKAKLRIAELQAENTQLRRKMAPLLRTGNQAANNNKQGDVAKLEDSSMCNVEPMKMTMQKKPRVIQKKKNLSQSVPNAKKPPPVIAKDSSEVCCLAPPVFMKKLPSGSANNAVNSKKVTPRVSADSAAARKLAFKKQIEIIKKRIDDNTSKAAAKRKAETLAQQKKIKKDIDKLGSAVVNLRKEMDERETKRVSAPAAIVA